jgi:hypothetical protein
MDVLGWALLIGGSMLVGVAIQLDRPVPGAPYRWLLTSAGALVGAFLASEWLFATTQPVLGGVALWPALLGGLVVAILVDVPTVLLVEGSPHGTTGHGRPVA